MKTGNTWTCWPGCVSWRMPQWSPVMKTGNTEKGRADVRPVREPQWSPVMKTGNTAMRETGRNGYQTASMEPGHEDREYLGVVADSDVFVAPQWSPVMKTGNTRVIIFPRLTRRWRLNGARS